MFCRLHYVAGLKRTADQKTCYVWIGSSFIEGLQCLFASSTPVVACQAGHDERCPEEQADEPENCPICTRSTLSVSQLYYM